MMEFESDRSGSKSSHAIRSEKQLLLKFDTDFKYAGSQDFILYDVARAEQHFFVDADRQGRIKRMYWVQFEGYLPSNTQTYRELLSQRLVNLVDESKRIELMIIYIEDLLGMGLTANDLSPGGRAADQWETVSRGFWNALRKGWRYRVSSNGHSHASTPSPRFEDSSRKGTIFSSASAHLPGVPSS